MSENKSDADARIELIAGELVDFCNSHKVTPLEMIKLAAFMIFSVGEKTGALMSGILIKVIERVGAYGNYNVIVGKMSLDVPKPPATGGADLSLPN